MNITIERIEEGGRLAMISVQGDLDRSNYQELVARARELHDQGVEQMLLDLSQTTFLSSSGLVAIHSVALLMKGEELSDPELGWAAIHAVGNASASGRQQRVKLLNPQARVKRTLVQAGLDQFFDIHSNRETALSSF